MKTGSLRKHLDVDEEEANIFMVAHVTYVYGTGGNDSSKGCKKVISAVQEEAHCCSYCFLCLFELSKSKTYYCYVNGKLLNNQLKFPHEMKVGNEMTGSGVGTSKIFLL